MEFLDVLDEKGNKNGKKKLRTEVHRDGDWHGCIHVWLVNSSGQVLLQKRSANVRTYPGLWAYSAGGHILVGEEREEAVIRELREEMGIVVDLDEIKLAFVDRNQDIENNNQIDYVFLVIKEIDIKSVKAEKEEVEKVQWFSIDEFERLKRTADERFVPKSDHYVNCLFKALREVNNGRSAFKKPLKVKPGLRGR